MMVLKELAAATARQWLAENRVIIDTETTGLSEGDEIVEIAAIDCTGKVLLNCLVKPKKPIPAEVIAIHGITNEMVADAADWDTVCEQFVWSLIQDNGFVAYNAEFDSRLMIQSLENEWAAGAVKKLMAKAECAKLLYAEYRGEPGKFKGYKWHKLTDAAAAEGVEVDGQAHRALADCLMTLGVIKAMAEGGLHE